MDILQDFTIFVTDFFVVLLRLLGHVINSGNRCTIEIPFEVALNQNQGISNLLIYVFYLYKSSVALPVATVLIATYCYNKHYNEFISPYTSGFWQLWAFSKATLFGIAICVLVAAPSFEMNKTNCTSFYAYTAIGYAIFMFMETVFNPTHRSIGSRQGIGSFHLIHYLLSQRKEAEASAKSDKSLFEKFGLRLGQAVEKKTEYLTVSPVVLTHYHELSGKNRRISLLFRIMLAPIISLFADQFIFFLIEQGVGRSFQAIIAIYSLINAFNQLFLPVISVFYGPIFILDSWVREIPLLVGFSQFMYGFILFAILMRGTAMGFLLPTAVFLYACCMTTFLGYFSFHSTLGFFTHVADLFNRLETGSGFIDWILRFSLFDQIERELRLLDRAAFFAVGSVGLVFWWVAFVVVYFNVWHTPAGQVTYGGKIRLPEDLPAYGFDRREFVNELPYEPHRADKPVEPQEREDFSPTSANQNKGKGVEAELFTIITDRIETDRMLKEATEKPDKVTGGDPDQRSPKSVLPYSLNIPDDWQERRKALKGEEPSSQPDTPLAEPEPANKDVEKRVDLGIYDIISMLADPTQRSKIHPSEREIPAPEILEQPPTVIDDEKSIREQAKREKLRQLSRRGKDKNTVVQLGPDQNPCDEQDKQE